MSIRKWLENEMRGDEWLADTTLDYVEVLEKEAEARGRRAGLEEAAAHAETASGLITSLEERADWTSGWNAAARAIASNIRAKVTSQERKDE